MTNNEISQSSILRINDAKTQQLLELCKKEECLWNTSLGDYPNKTKRQIAAEKIAKQLNIPHFEAKHVLMKFKNLRNCYCQELKKIKRSMKAVEAGGAASVYRPTVAWFPIMDSFIQPHLQFFRPTEMKDPLLSASNLEQSNRMKMEYYESDGQENWVTGYAEHSGAEGHSENDDLSNEFRPKRRKFSSSGKVEISVPQNDSQDCIPSSQISVKTEDMHDTFGRYIASLLRNLDQNDALKLQRSIVNMIVDVGLKDSRIELDIKEEPLDRGDYD